MGSSLMTLYFGIVICRTRGIVQTYNFVARYGSLQLGCNRRTYMDNSENIRVVIVIEKVEHEHTV